MTEPISSGLPAWVYKRDGRLVPFEADRISQALFAASEALGKPNAFLARELTGGVLHFLAGEAGSAVPTTAQIADLVIKIVRELGQPALSQAFADGNRRRLRSSALPSTTPRTEEQGTVVHRFAVDAEPAQVVRDCLREYSLHAIYARDLTAAHRDGLLTLVGLETPAELAGCVFDLARRGLEAGQGESRAWSHSRRSGALVRALQEVRGRAGSFLAIDGPEYALTPFATASDLSRNSGELGAGLQATGLAAVINLNCAEPPGWAEEHTEGPLFAEQRRSSPPAHVHEFRMVLLEHLLHPSLSGRVRIDWHLSERDFQGTQAEAQLHRLARLAVESPAVSFVFDRPGRVPALAEGIDRKHPAVLQAVGVNLPRLLELPETRAEPANLLLKLPSLARMAVSAAVQKRAFLRRRSHEREALTREFLLDRARLVVVPLGLDALVRAVVGSEMCASHAALEFGQQILSSLNANLRQAGREASLEVCLDNPCCTAFTSAGGFSLRGEEPDEVPSLADIAGITCWSPGTDLQVQLKTAGLLHAAAEGGTAAILLVEDRLPAPEEAAELLGSAWKRTEVNRLRFLHVPHQQPQLAW